MGRRVFSTAMTLWLAVACCGPGDARAGRDGQDDPEPRDATVDHSGSSDSSRLDSGSGEGRSEPPAALDSRSGGDTSGSSGSSGSGSGLDDTRSSGSGDSGSTGGSGSGDTGSGGSGSSGSDSGGSGSGDTGSGGSGTSGSNSSGSGSGSSGSGSSGSSGSGSGSGSDDSGSGGGDAPVSAGADRAPIDIETDADGRERNRGEVLFSGGARALAAAQAVGFELLSVEALAGVDHLLARFRVRTGSTVELDSRRLRQLDGAVRAEPNFVFRFAADPPTAGTVARQLLDTTPGPAVAHPAMPGFAGHVGMVDTGVDTAQGVLRPAVGAQRAFCGRYTPRPHGALVAQILAGHGMHIEVADVFQLDTKGQPVATAESVARGVDWLEKLAVPVINVSLAGPDSDVLAEVIARAATGGILVVAAVGNDGPAAPPEFPAAMPGVVGVTAIDDARKVYRRAGQGPQVDFSARGVRVPLRAPDGSVEYVSGTSYAAPLVAAIVATRHRVATPASAREALARLQATAIDLGAPGRDPVFGWGLLGSGADRAP